MISSSLWICLASRVYDVNSGKQTRSYKGTPGDDGTLVRVSNSTELHHRAMWCDMSCFKRSVLPSKRNALNSVIIVSCESTKEVKTGKDWDGLRLKESLKNVCKVVQDVIRKNVISVHPWTFSRYDKICWSVLTQSFRITKCLRGYKAARFLIIYWGATNFTNRANINACDS